MKEINIPIHWIHLRSQGFSLLPSNFDSFTAKVTFSFDSRGSIEWDQVIDEIERQAQQTWKIPAKFGDDFDAPGGILNCLKESFLEEGIQQFVNPLEYFSLADSAKGRSGNGLLLPMVYKPSGWHFGLDCTPGPDGKPIARELIDALEQAVRNVYQFSSQWEVFTNVQKGSIGKAAAEWVAGLMKEAGIVLPRAEVDLESGVLKEDCISMIVKVTSDRVEYHELMLPGLGIGALDLTPIRPLSAGIAKDWFSRMGARPGYWLEQMLVAQIGPPAKAYGVWIMEVEISLRKELYKEGIAELKRRLARAEELKKELESVIAQAGDQQRLVKFIEDLNKSERDAVAAKYQFRHAEYSNQFEATVTKIYKELSELGGAVERGVRPHLGEMGKGLGIALIAAGLVMWEAAWIVAVDALLVVWSAVALKAFKIMIKVGIDGKLVQRGATYLASPPLQLEVGTGRAIVGGTFLKSYLLDFGTLAQDLTKNLKAITNYSLEEE